MKATAVSCSWPCLPLSRVASLQKGKKPGRLRQEGALPYLEASILRGTGAPRYVPREDIAQLVLAEQTDTLLLLDGANAGELFPGTTGVVCSTMAYIRPRHHTISPAFLRYYLLTQTNRLRTTTAGSTVPHVRKRIVESLPVPLPPLPVQERIVAILQKADEIRRKRQEALKIADQILPALFIEMFGDLQTYSRAPIAELCQIYGGKRLPRGASYSDVPTAFRYLRVSDIADGRIAADGMNYLPPDIQAKIARYTVCPGDVVISIAGEAGITAVVPPHVGETWNLTENMAALRVAASDSGQIEPFFLLWFLRSEGGRAQIARAAASSTIQKLALFRLAQIEVPVPPPEEQQRFAEYASAYESVRGKLQASLRDAETTFNVLLQQAFTGELTAEWEARNADWIAERQAFYQRLPQLVLLAFLHEKAQQDRKAGVLITALMKYAFLLQMEGASRRRFYNFVPYHYGPFAQEIYSDLENLQQQGLVTIEENDEKTRISLTAPHRAEQALQELPEDLRHDVAAIVEAYGNLDHEGLLKVVYERYPAYAKKSRRMNTRKRSE